MKNTIRAFLLCFSVFGLVFSGHALAQSGSQTGYQEIESTKRAAEGKVEVVEYFWFGCPHCYAFEPSINGWAANKPEHVDFVREAPPLNPSWTNHSKAFYAAEVLGVTEQFFEPLFNAIHKDKKRLNTPKALAKFAGTVGIDEDKFRKTMDSFAVDAKIRRALDMARNDGIRSVPSVVVNGQYMTSGSIAGSYERVIEVIQELSEREKVSG